MIVGIVFGGICFLVLCTFLCICCCASCKAGNSAGGYDPNERLNESFSSYSNNSQGVHVHDHTDGIVWGPDGPMEKHTVTVTDNSQPGYIQPGYPQ